MIKVAYKHIQNALCVLKPALAAIPRARTCTTLRYTPNYYLIIIHTHVGTIQRRELFEGLGGNDLATAGSTTHTSNVM